MGIFSRQRRWRSAKPRRSAPQGRDVRRRAIGLYFAVFAVFAVLSVQLLRMQVIGGSEYRLQADGNRLRVVSAAPPRGLIFDRTGRPMVENVPVFSVSVIPGDLPLTNQPDVLGTLQSVLGVPVYQLEQRLAQVRDSIDPFQPVVVKKEVDKQTAMILYERQRSLPGVSVENAVTRIYPYGDVLGQVLGYTGSISQEELAEFRQQGYAATERVGKAGVELTYESRLHGIPGRAQQEIDAAGRKVRDIENVDPKPGANLVLSLDAELQKAVTGILKDSVAGLASSKSVAMVMDVRTGEILADVSLPTFNSNLFSYQVDDEAYAALINDPKKPLLNHSIAEKFAPGSTFKMVTGVAALQEGIATTRTTITSKGTLLVPREYNPEIKDSFPDWHPNLGTLDFYRGVAMSSDIYFYCLAGGQCPELKEGLGSSTLARYARMFGFGELTGIDLPGETEGLVGDAVWLQKESKGRQQWYTADTFFLGIGQGYVEATPLQVLRMTAAVANGGLVLRPKVVREVRDADGTVIVPARTEVVRRVDVDPKNLAIMREAMRLSVTDGTANKAAAPGVSVAAKTGTAEFGARLGAGSIYGRYKEHGWTVAFGPYENPEIAVVVFNEEGSGANTAAPTVGRILDYYFNQRPKLTLDRPENGP